MSSSCSIEVTLNKRDDEYYTNYDTISGDIILKVNKEINVQNVQIKLEGLASTSITKRVRKANGDHRTETRSESHELLYDFKTLFPPDNVKQVSKSTEFQLTPGTYKYDFAFRMPMVANCGDISNENEQLSYHTNSPYEKKYDKYHRSKNTHPNPRNHHNGPLPPTLSFNKADGRVSVKYLLKVTIRRSSFLKANIRYITPIKFTNFDSLYEVYHAPVLLPGPKHVFVDKQLIEETPEEERNEVEDKHFFKRLFKNDSTQNISKFDVPFQLVLQLDTSCLTAGNTIGATLKLLSKVGPHKYRDSNGNSNGLGLVYVDKFVVQIFARTDYRADVFTDSSVQTYDLINTSRAMKVDLANLELANSNDKSQYELELASNFFENIRIPQLPSSFHFCNINLNYVLKIRVDLAPKAGAWRSKDSAWTIPITLLSGIPPPADLALRGFDHNNQEQAWDAPPGPPPSATQSKVSDTKDSSAFAPPPGPPPNGKQSQIVNNTTGSSSQTQPPAIDSDQNGHHEEALPSYGQATGGALR